MSRVRSIFAAVFLILFLCVCWSLAGEEKTSSTSPPPVEKEALTPPGASSSYIIGTSLLKKGDVKEGLQYLHHAYTLGPEVREFAVAYLDALLAGGYVMDALAVVERLVEQHPVDLSLRRREIDLLMEVGREQKTLERLKAARSLGCYEPDMALLEARIENGLGHTDRALELCREVLTEVPDESEQIFVLMASVLELAGRQTDLAALWDEAVAALPESAPVLFGRLRHLVSTGRIEEARAAVVAADMSGAVPSIKDAEQEVVWELELVNLLLEAGQTDEVRDILQSRQAAGVVSGLDESLVLARILVDAGDGEAMVEFMADAIEQWPADPRGHYFVGDVAAMRGDLQLAESELGEAIRLDPYRAMYRIAMVRVLILKYNEAVAAGETVEMLPTAEVVEAVRVASALLGEENQQGHLILGYAMRRIGEPRKAAEHFDIAAMGQESRQDALMSLSLCYEDMEEFSRARSTLEMARREYGDSPTVANALGYFLADRNRDLERAAELIAEALAGEPDNGSFIDSMGWVHYRKGNLDEAFDYLVEAVNIFPRNPTILEHLGIVMITMGRQVEGLRVLRQARNAGGDSRTLLDAIGAVERELGLD